MNGAILYPMEADDYIFILKKLAETDRIAVVMEVPSDGTDNIEDLKGWVEYWTEMQDIVSADPDGFRLGASREYNPVGEAEFESERFSVPDDGNDLSIEIIYPNNYAAVWMVACALYSSYHLIVVDRASLRGDAASFFRRTGVLNAVFGRLYFRPLLNFEWVNWASGTVMLAGSRAGAARRSEPLTPRGRQHAGSWLDAAQLSIQP